MRWISTRSRRPCVSSSPPSKCRAGSCGCRLCRVRRSARCSVICCRRGRRHDGAPDDHPDDRPRMSPAALSLLALLLVVAVSLTSRLNVGVLAVALAWAVGVFAAGWKVDQVMAAFPSSLFLTLLGVTLLFGVAQANGSMEALTHAGLRALRGHVAWLPLLLFGLAGVISSLGPGSIATAALLAPIAMGLAHRARVPMLLAALMIGNGVNAGNLSPISAIGVLV
ncbi:MAG: hypothetical protein EBV77_10390, partial [Gemmatimonadaceae bacterium]|nr:hypothetical protein [Gemmatimonadaceae bacterium]